MNILTTLHTVNPILSINANLQYREIANAFTNYYYRIYDNNFSELHNLYIANPCITYGDDEFIKFMDLHDKVRYTYSIYKYTHTDLIYTAQPFNDGILINISGSLSINYGLSKKFNETIMLVKNNSNIYYISNSILKLI